MANFEFKELGLEGAFLISGFFAGDVRGGFTKSFEREVFAEAGIPFDLSETFASRSSRNVIRGLHFQTHQPQAKLVSVVAGRAWDVIVDLRLDSPTFAQWKACELSVENHLGIFVPRGFAHGFASLEDGTVMLYQCDGAYDASTDTGVVFNDPYIGIDWPVREAVAIHSERDLRLQSLKAYMEHPMEL